MKRALQIGILLLLFSGRPTAAASITYPTSGLTLGSNQSVTVGGTTTLIMQSDGNLVIYQNSVPVWASGTAGNSCASGCAMYFQIDGNLVAYSGTTPLWASNTVGAKTLVFQNIAPYLQILSSAGKVVWATSVPVVPPFLPPSPVQANSVPPGPWPGDLNILSYGAVSGGVTDNYTAITNALNAAISRGVGVFVPAGTFAYGAELAVRGVRLDGVGIASNLIALNGNSEPIMLEGSGSIVANLLLTTTYKGPRLTAPWNTAVDINGATNFQVDHVFVDGSASAGIFDDGGQEGKITNNTVENTLADSIINTNGAGYLLIDSNYIENSGDDGISIVAYTNEPYNYDITVSNNVILNNAWGRNLSVVGGQSITYKNNYANGNTMGLACLYFASEPTAGAETLGAENVTASDNTLMNCGSPSSGYAALTISGPTNAPVSNNNITVTNTIIAPGGQPGVGIYGPRSYNISFSNNKETGQSANNFGSSGQVIQNVPWASGPVGYVPSPAGVSGIISVVP